MTSQDEKKKRCSECRKKKASEERKKQACLSINTSTGKKEETHIAQQE